VDVTVVGLPERMPVLEVVTRGPLLMADLPPGRYEVISRYGDVVAGRATEVRKTVTIPTGGQARSVIYFDTGDATDASARLHKLI
jgi:hypothetical protein